YPDLRQQAAGDEEASCQDHQSRSHHRQLGCGYALGTRVAGHHADVHEMVDPAVEEVPAIHNPTNQERDFHLHVLLSRAWLHDQTRKRKNLSSAMATLGPTCGHLVRCLTAATSYILNLLRNPNSATSLHRRTAHHSGQNVMERRS